ncbi:unnamed protein product [Dovyalis caffra]|uniref:Leucine-rich repeat-containing N-terminal plant-type domain-containing protein n=1 Tax=Dovyalis caffra TaxID=77055 RepID=A0AAV1RYS4_9ROSI|nr:unnamed protein product [Dovyalis caffra]
MWVRMLVMLALVNEWCHCCLEEERIGLLEIKVWINDPNPNILSDWVDNKKDTDCCKWHGVKCDSTTKRVVELSLEDTKNDYWRYEDLYLNASLFLPFIELRSLNLTRVGLFCCFKNQGFEILSSKLRKLETLNLDFNQFNDSILLSLGQLSSLKSLNLADNWLTGSTSINGFEVLVSGLRKLEELDLSGNTLSDNILSFLHELSSLKILDLSYNNLTTISSGINGKVASPISNGLL